MPAHGFSVPTTMETLVADYAGRGLPDVQKLPGDTYMALRRDAFISELGKSEKGREYLENAWRMTLTGADREASRKAFGGE